MKQITSFTGKYFFLSNFYENAGFWMDGLYYPSSEHAYMSGKTDDMNIKIKISQIKKPGECKKFCSKNSNNFKLVDNWEDIKYSHMEKVLKTKFSIPEMEEKLLETKGYYLIEGNTLGIS